jgi:hypothetical protein
MRTRAAISLSISKNQLPISKNQEQTYRMEASCFIYQKYMPLLWLNRLINCNLAILVIFY